MTRGMAETKARIWTIEELTRVHPLPDGWTWAAERVTAVRGDWEVWLDDEGELCSWYEPDGGSMLRCDPPADVALAVILASKGLDSLAAMADALDKMADTALSRIKPLVDAGRSERAYQADGDATGLRTGARMVRRGTVNP